MIVDEMGYTAGSYLVASSQQPQAKLEIFKSDEHFCVEATQIHEGAAVDHARAAKQERAEKTVFGRCDLAGLRQLRSAGKHRLDSKENTTVFNGGREMATK